MAFFYKEKGTTGDPFIDAVISYQSTDLSSFTGVNAIKNSDIFTAVKIIASDIASSPLQTLKGGIPQKENTIVHLMNHKPNETMDGWHFKFSLVVNLLLNGNSFAEIVRDEKGEVNSLKLLKNSEVKLIQQEDETLDYQVNKRNVNSKNILHFKYFTQDGLVGISPLHALKDEIKIQQAGNRTWFNFFSKGINSNGILKVHKADLDSEAKKAIREKFEEANSSQNGENAIRTIIMDEGMDYSPLEINTDILKLVNSSDWTTKQISKVFGIPSERLGVENVHSSTTQNNMVYLKNTLIHYFNSFLGELNDKLLNEDDEVFQFNTDYLMELDPESKISNLIKQVQGSLLTVNEARAKMGLMPVNGGERLLGSLNYTYLDVLQDYQFKDKESETLSGK